MAKEKTWWSKYDIVSMCYECDTHKVFCENHVCTFHNKNDTCWLKKDDVRIGVDGKCLNMEVLEDESEND